MLFISDAFAAAPAVGEPSAIAGILPILLIGLVFYFLIIRPQQKKYKDHMAMIKAVKKGDRVVTSGGIIGTVNKIDDANDTLQVEIADGVRIKIVRSTLASVLTEEGTESNDNKKAA
ncbi:MAG: preprotein translocase subunit YajC [Alphaproteobacteria bacterium]|nr:preprotein translocase subunit YajC [Alphaproteobacteria bacterium]